MSEITPDEMLKDRSCNRHIPDTSTYSDFEDKVSRIQHRKAMAGSCCVFAQDSNDGELLNVFRNNMLQLLWH